MDIYTALVVFAAALFALVKGADYLIQGAEKIGRYFGMPSFVIGALIVGVGTSLPEVASSMAAIFAGETDIVVSNAVDGVVTTLEAAILFLGFLVYLSYLLLHPDESNVSEEKTAKTKKKKEKLVPWDFVYLIGGGISLVVGANYLIQSVIVIAESFGIPTGVVAISAVAVGTSLPEIIVSVTAVLKGKTDLAFGNVFGSNVFNVLLMVGLVGLFENLTVDNATYVIGLPVFIAVTVMFTISAMSKRIYIWEGMMFLVFYLFFMVQLFGVA